MNPKGNSEIEFVSMGKIKKELLLKFSQAGKDPNPIHLDHDAAVKAGLKGPIAHGMLLATMMSSRLEQFMATRKGLILSSAQFRFKSMTFLGEEIFIGGKIAHETAEAMDVELLARSQGAAGELKTSGKFKLTFRV